MDDFSDRHEWKQRGQLTEPVNDINIDMDERQHETTFFLVATYGCISIKASIINIQICNTYAHIAFDNILTYQILSIHTWIHTSY